MIKKTLKDLMFYHLSFPQPWVEAIWDNKGGFPQAQLIQDPTLDIQISLWTCTERQQRVYLFDTTNVDLCENKIKEHIYNHIHKYIARNIVIQ